jgi:hypothetical protein
MYMCMWRAQGLHEANAAHAHGAPLGTAAAADDGVAAAAAHLIVLLPLSLPHHALP